MPANKALGRPLFAEFSSLTGAGKRSVLSKFMNKN
jgi:hypothetical protein